MGLDVFVHDLKPYVKLNDEVKPAIDYFTGILLRHVQVYGSSNMSLKYEWLFQNSEQFMR